MLSVGYPAPNFALEDQNGKKNTLLELLKKGPIVLYFYPADFTPGCTKEACSFRDAYPQVTEKGWHIVGISPQGVDSHKNFREKHQLPFTLLSDPDKTTIRAYEALGPFGMVRRITYQIDQKGIVRGAVKADFRITKHEAFLSDALQKAPAAAATPMAPSTVQAG